MGAHGGRTCVFKILSLFLASRKNKSVVEPQFLPPGPREPPGSHTVDLAPDELLGSAWWFQDPGEPAQKGLLIVSESFFNKNEGGTRIDNPRIHL